MALDQVVRDCLVAALQAVPITHYCLTPGDRPEYGNCCHDVVDVPALAVAAREWTRRQMVEPEVLALALCLGDPDACPPGQVEVPCPTHLHATSFVLADVARRLGL